MENELFLDDDEEIVPDEGALGGFLEEPGAPPVATESAPVKIEVDTSSIGKTIADALSGATEAQTNAFRSLANEFMSAQPKPGAPKLTKEQIAERNVAIGMALANTDGSVDIVETIRGLVNPIVRSEIEGTMQRVRPEADNLAAGQGERFVSDFKREIKGAVNEKLYAKYEAEIDKLIPDSKFALLAQATPSQRKAFFEETRERADGRVYRAALSDKTPRGQVTGSGGGGGKSPLQQAYSALPKEEQREGQSLARAFARAAGHKEGTAEYIKAYNAKLQDYVEG